MHAFISHSSQDSDFAFHVVSLLEAEGIGCWIAPRDIPIGSSYASEILTAIEKSRCVAIVFTEAANASPHVLREVERAIKYRRPLVALRPESAQPTGQFDYFLATVHCPALPPISSEKSPLVYAQAVSEFCREERAESRPRAMPLQSRESAHESLWQMATDLELRYREACRNKLSDDEWVGLSAIEIVLNEFLILNRRHFPRELQTAVYRYSKAVARLAKATRECGDSAAAEDFESTRQISLDDLTKGTELFQANQEFESSYEGFEAAFDTSSKQAKA